MSQYMRRLNHLDLGRAVFVLRMVIYGKGVSPQPQRKNKAARHDNYPTINFDISDTIDLLRQSGKDFAAEPLLMEEEGLQAEILAQGISNFYRLYLLLESQRYLFRVLSAKLILTQPERYGFHLQVWELVSSHQLYQRRIDLPGGDQAGGGGTGGAG